MFQHKASAATSIVATTVASVASFLLLLDVTAASGPPCVCLGRGENATSSGSAEAGSAMPPVNFFTDKDYIEAYGSYCNEWLNPEGAPAICNDGKNCTEPWCYVAADADCDPSITYDTRFFADTEYAGTLKFSNDACIETDSGATASAVSGMASTAALCAVATVLFGWFVM